MENGVQGSSGEGKFKVFVTGLQDGTSVSVALHKSTFQKDFVVNGGETVPVHLPAHMEMVGSGTFHATIIVKASREITVSSLSSKPNSADTTVVYPRYLLGNTYYVTTPLGKPSKGFQEFSVVASQDPTQVFIYLTNQVTFQGATYTAGSKLTISLEAYQAAQIQSQQDLSGTKVVSHKPVAVLSGHSCIWSHNNCQHVFEQLLPTRRWGKAFLVPSLSSQTHYDVASVTAHQKTHLQVQAGATHSKYHLQPGQVISLEVWAQKPLYISSDVGVQVLFYSMGGVKKGVAYDPFLSSVLAVSEYSNSYYILGQEGFKNLALLVAETSACRSITFDKQSLHSAPWKAITGTSYSWTEFSFGGGLETHFVTHPKSPFSLLSIGVAHLNSYGSVALAISQAVPPGGPHPNPCSGTPCGKGYVCVLKHHHPECVPEACKTTKCQEGTLCEIVQGQPNCVPRPSCHHVQCPEGTTCDLAGGFPKCAPLPSSCAAVQCKEGTKCVLTHGWPKCIPGPASCQNTQCGQGTICEMVGGQPKCVQTPPSCLHIECLRGTVCDMVDGWPKCIPGPSCKDLKCEAGTECKMEGGLPRCLPAPPSCHDKTNCQPGTVCKMVNGKPTCIAVPPSCDRILCKGGTICEIVDGSPTCVAAIKSCEQIQCRIGTICEVVNGWPMCVPMPHSCENVACKAGTICDIVNGWPTCVPDAPTSCASVVCKERSVCEMVGGKPTCTPFPLSCEGYRCRQGTVCEVIHGWPTCVAQPPLCLQTKCNEGTACAMAHGAPKCVPIPSTCEKVQCQEGHVCTMVNGWPKCVPAPPSCENVYCQLGTICKMVQGWPSCVPIPPSCDNIHCGEGALCEMVHGWPQCRPTATSCDQIRCKGGMVCEMIDSWPTCVHIPASCDKVSCRSGTVCDMIDDWPTCVPVPSSCDQVRCKAGTACQLTDGWPRCIPLLLSCNHVQCQDGTVCEISDAGTVCQLINGSPACVPTALLSCDQTHCGPETVCDIVNGSPKCISMPGSCERSYCPHGTKCQVVNNQPKCVPAAQPCQTVRCGQGTVCKVVSGSPQCVPAAPTHSVCWASGQPHYHTFDGHSYDFQGTCTYTVVKLCKAHSKLPFFHIFTKGQKTPFSFVSQVTLTVYNSTITMVKYEYGLVRVNQLLSRLPIILHDGKLSLYHRGGQLEIETQFGLKVYYDWNHYLAVKVTSAFRSHVCGLCGNYNGDPNDDMVTSLGGLATDFAEFGKSWKVESGDGACSHGCLGKCWHCSPERVSHYSQVTYCGLIGKHRGGPFHPCHALVDPKPYLADCVADLCAFEGYKQILCRALKTYADACQREGATISAWRKHAGCPQSCPENSQYVACGSACPATCNDLNAPEKCHLPCLETCQCQSGYVLDGGKCIPKDRCGCIYHGHLYAPNEHFWGDQQCHQQCVCRPHDKQVVCHTSHCGQMEGCHVVNGVRNCYPTTYGTCSTQGQLHYTTFDGLRYDFYGTCFYRLAELCNKKVNLTDFQVLVQDEKSGPRDSSATKILEVTVYGMTVIIGHSKILLNGLLINLPYYIDHYKVLLYRHGWDIVVKTDFGLTIAFDGKNNIRLTVPGTYRRSLCGLCGTFNGEASDDMTQPDGVATTSPADFAKSFKVRDIPGCAEVEKENCIDIVNVERAQKKSQECGILLDQSGPFKMCHGTVSPQWYFKDCVYDYCFNKGNQTVICHIISSYAAACQAAGAKIYEWRSNQFCKPDCPANSHYKVCASDCPVTCRNLFDPVLCATKCREGCECNEGYVLSSDQCVPISQCGCVHQGFYYKAGESFYVNGFCKEWCVCQVGGIIQCQHSSCGPGEECRVVDGIQKCHGLTPKRGGACHVVGDPHYLTFDGFTFDIQSNCTYTLVKSCARTNSLPSFEVNVENERRARGKVSVTKSVSVTVYQHTVTILREKRGIILVNGATLYLPFGLESNGMWVYYHGDNVVLRTDFGLFVSFDQLYHLLVMVPESYRGQTCGLCGNYNGNSRDDLFLPNRQPTGIISAFAAGWKVDAPPAVCTEDCGGFVCGACRESRKANYVHTSQCGILRAPYGPFSACYATINPTAFFDNCVHDLCKARGNPVILCRVIHGYVTACQAAGIKINPWRTQQFCPVKCPANSHYELCASACSANCKEAANITKCPSNCAEGCQCNRGYLMAGYHCVPVGVKVITANCMEECTCHRQGRVVCRPLPCAARESCVLSNAKWSCVLREGHCTIAQRHTFTSYDGVSGNIPSDGSYEISSLDDTKAEFWFRVVVKVQKCPTCPTPAVDAVTVYFHNLIVLVNRNSIVSVNGQLVHLPVQPSKNISVSLTQDVVTVRQSSHFRVLFGTNGDVTVVISGNLANKVSRSCGNFNGNGADDLLLPNGQVAHTITEVIRHWTVTTATQQGTWG
ncbi:hypothetical protein lerEdw1_009813 [Lerista edwardsae]|nr:hypothetical protein lerEdw1_009813 [Lerista edwardsae]